MSILVRICPELRVVTNVGKKNYSTDTDEKMSFYSRRNWSTRYATKMKLSSYDLTSATSIFFLFVIYIPFLFFEFGQSSAHGLQIKC